MTVLEPTFLINQSLSERRAGTLKVQGDVISAASVENRFPSGTQSGAFGDRTAGLEAGAFYAWSDQISVGGGVTHPAEFDGHSRGFFLNGSYDRPSKNDAFAVTFSACFDSLDLVYFDGTQVGTDTRHAFSMGPGWTHILGTRTLGTLNRDLILQNGHLSTPCNPVVAAIGTVTTSRGLARKTP